MKSDRRIYGPTYAWRDLSKKLLRLSESAPKTTSVLLRGIRFSCKYDLTIETKTLSFFKERIESAKSDNKKMGNYIISMGLDKMIEDGFSEKCFNMMKELGFPYTDKNEVNSLEDLKRHNARLILNGQGYHEPRDDYDD
jgi:tRNA nucleotidyltransferase/poly(A) polymerase